MHGRLKCSLNKSLDISEPIVIYYLSILYLNEFIIINTVSN